MNNNINPAKSCHLPSRRNIAITLMFAIAMLFATNPTHAQPNVDCPDGYDPYPLT